MPITRCDAYGINSTFTGGVHINTPINIMSYCLDVSMFRCAYEVIDAQPS